MGHTWYVAQAGAVLPEIADMSAELIAIIAVGATLLVGLGGLIVAVALWMGGWLRDVNQRLARLEGMVSGLFRTPDAPAPSAGD